MNLKNDFITKNNIIIVVSITNITNMKILLLLAFFFSVFCLQAQEKKKSAHKSTSFKINITPSTEFKLPNGELISYKKFQLLSLEGDYSIDFESLSPEKSYEIYPTKKNSKEEKKRILKHYKQKSNKTGGTIFKNEKGKVISYYEFKTLENTGKWIGGGKKDPDTGEFYLQLRKPNERDKKRKIHTEWKRKIIGTPAPKFEIIDMDGNRINSENTKGKVVFLNFWFTTCKPCIMEIPDLNKIYQKYKNNPPQIL